MKPSPKLQPRRLRPLPAKEVLFPTKHTPPTGNTLHDPDSPEKRPSGPQFFFPFFPAMFHQLCVFSWRCESFCSNLHFGAAGARRPFEPCYQKFFSGVYFSKWGSSETTARCCLRDASDLFLSRLCTPPRTNFFHPRPVFEQHLCACCPAELTGLSMQGLPAEPSFRTRDRLGVSGAFRRFPADPAKLLPL